MKTTIKMPAHTRRFTQTPRRIDSDYMDCTWSQVFDAAWELYDEEGYRAAIPATVRRMMGHVARYAPTMTLRRAAKGW